MKRAVLKCRICKVPYEVKINSLQIEVDVYCKWIDECQRLEDAKRSKDGGLGLVSNEEMGARPGKKREEKKESDSEDDDNPEEEEEVSESE